MIRAGAIGNDAVATDAGDLANVHAGIDAYYTAKVTKFGATPPGVDWSCRPTQELRFVQLLRLCDFSAAFSLNDLGCGYGALIAYLERCHPGCEIDYLGIDLSRAMLRRARRLWGKRTDVAFAHGHDSPRRADYAVASGIFNVQIDQPSALWERFVAKTLDQLHRSSNKGFAVNFMKAPSDGKPARNGIYTTPPDWWARYCADRFGAATEVLDGYGLREFTLIVRRRPVSTRP
jgi:SAM-dependent methyltransferase